MRHCFPETKNERKNFNPRTHRGVRQKRGAFGFNAANFNPRTHRGVRLNSQYVRYIARDNFNPRTHRGVRLLNFLTSSRETRFQSTHPSWGATKFTLHKCNLKKNFNPRTHRGVRLNSQYVRYIARDNFNPRTHRGVRLLNFLTSSRETRFQSTHPSWGATLGGSVFSASKYISIHAPIVGCD